jgi:hypothetical protein
VGLQLGGPVAGGDPAVARLGQPRPVGVGVGQQGLAGLVPGGVVLGANGLGVGRGVGGGLLPDLLEALPLGVAVGAPDDLAELLGVLLQLVVGGLAVGGVGGQHAPGLAHGEQGVDGEVLLEGRRQLLRLGRGDRRGGAALVLGVLAARLGRGRRAGGGLLRGLGVAGGHGREQDHGEEDRTGS